jgi:hypothetical protein
LLVRKSAERFPAHFTTHPLLGEAGRLVKSLGVAIDE